MAKKTATDQPLPLDSAAPAAPAAPPPPPASTTIAKVTAPFSGCKDGDLHPTRFAPGDEVTGELADVAVREGWAV